MPSGKDVRHRDFADLDAVDRHAQYMAGGEDRVRAIPVTAGVGGDFDLAVDQV